MNHFNTGDETMNHLNTGDKTMIRRTVLVVLSVMILVSTITFPCLASEKKKIIQVVCMGNIMRSVIAKELIKRKLTEDGIADQYIVDSRGIQGTPASPTVPSHSNLSFYNKANGSNAWESSLPALEKIGIVEQFKKHKATVVSESDLKKAAIIIVMDQKVMNNPKYGLKAQFPGYEEKMVLITELVGSAEGIADAYQKGSEGNKYEKTVYKIADVVERGYPNLLKRIK